MSSKKLNLRDHLEDNALDLSMADLEEVPVKDIALIKKATSLDLSSNRLAILKNNFAMLTHLTKLDLSKNQLTALPENFGDLVLLKSLDLYRNKLTHLPLSLGQLKSLRWLDLKDNPLVPVLAEVAGPCLDRTQCQQCAKKIVLFLQDMSEQVEKRKQEIIEKGLKEQEAAQKKEEAKKKKKLSKADKKKENGMKNVNPVVSVGIGDSALAKKALSKINGNHKTINHHVSEPVPQKKKEIKRSSGGSFSGKFFRFLLTLFVMSVISLVTLHSVDRERYDVLTQAASKGWDSFVLTLPPQVVSSGSRVADAARPAVKLVWTQLLDVGNQTAAKVQEGYVWLKTNEQSHHFIMQAESMWGVVCNRASEFYRTVYELTLITVESVKKKVF